MWNRENCVALVKEFDPEKVAEAVKTVGKGAPVAEVRDFIIHGGLNPEA
jgi:hypothetical protein